MLFYLSLLWKYTIYDHFSMPTYFPTTLYIIYINDARSSKYQIMKYIC